MTADLESRVAALERQIARLERRTKQGVSFARSTAKPIDDGPVQTAQSQLDALSVRNDVPVLFYYGFSSAMPVGGDKLVIHGNGERSSAIAVASGHQQYRYKNLLEGETVLYDRWNHSVRLTQVEVVMTGQVRIVGDLHVTGEVIRGHNTSDQVALGTHKHTTNEPPPVAGT